MLILEIAGPFEPQKLLALVQEGETLEHIPYAALGDYSLRLHTPINDARAEQLLQGLQTAGLEVLGYRWRQQHQVPVARVQPQAAPVQPWYTRLFGNNHKAPVGQTTREA